MTPTRWEKMIKQADIKDSDTRPLQWVERILINEHRAVVRKVKQMGQAIHDNNDMDYPAHKIAVLTDLLDWLKARGR